mgnify:CR=1 FL=1
MPEFKTQGEKVKFFTLMIPEIAGQKVEISSASKTCDMSRQITTFRGNCSSILDLRPATIRLS